MNAYVWLGLGIAFEVCGTLGLKSTEGFNRLAPTALVLCCYAASFFFVSRAVLGLEVGVVYAIWSGVGTSLVAAITIIFFGEQVSPLKIASLVLIVVGVVGLNVAGSH